MGLSNTRNRAIAKASGDYITFIDADDFVEPNYIEAMITVARDNDSDIVVSLYNQFLQESQEYAWLQYPSSDMFQVDKQFIADEIYCRRYHIAFLSMWGKLFRTKLFTGVRFPNRRYFEDNLVYQLYFKSDNIHFLDTVLYWYRIRPQSITSTQQTLQHFEDLYASFQYTTMILALSRLDLTNFNRGALQGLKGLRNAIEESGYDYTPVYFEVNGAIEILEHFS